MYLFKLREITEKCVIKVDIFKDNIGRGLIKINEVTER